MLKLKTEKRLWGCDVIYCRFVLTRFVVLILIIIIISTIMRCDWVKMEETKHTKNKWQRAGV
jgi:hypothetical protein